LTPAPAATVALVRQRPLVHAAWTAEWWGGSSKLAAVFGPPPSLVSLTAAAEEQSRHAAWRWPPSTRSAPGHAPPDGALVVLAGQQPALAGGAALVAHKAATAIRLAQVLAETLRRPVVPVFLLGDEDHDTTEVDHVDGIDEASGRLHRHRCPITPRSARLADAHWDAARLAETVRAVASVSEMHAASFEARCGRLASDPVSEHVAQLMLDAFGAQGLVCVRSSELSAAAPQIAAAALGDPGWARDALAAGAEGLTRAGLAASFDPADRRPLVFESRDARRRRVLADDAGAADRQRAAPTDFSPHAALRPIVQAAALPVVAQVCGPSELLYLGQARGLHERFGLRPPVLVPRLEATRLTPAQLRQLGGELRAVDLDEAARHAHPLAAEQEALERAAERLELAVTRAAPGLAARARRWRQAAERTARRLAEEPHWHGRGGGAWSALRPRGRAQDTVLAWLPDAWRAGRPEAWGRHIVMLCRPLDPPEHVLHLLPEEPPHG